MVVLCGVCCCCCTRCVMMKVLVGCTADGLGGGERGRQGRSACLRSRGTGHPTKQGWLRDWNGFVAVWMHGVTKNLGLVFRKRNRHEEEEWHQQSLRWMDDHQAKRAGQKLESWKAGGWGEVGGTCLERERASEREGAQAQVAAASAGCRCREPQTGLWRRLQPGLKQVPPST